MKCKNIIVLLKITELRVSILRRTPIYIFCHPLPPFLLCHFGLINQTVAQSVFTRPCLNDLMQLLATPRPSAP